AATPSPALAVGALTLAACYSGTSTYSGSSGTTTETVNKAVLSVTADIRARAYGDPDIPFTATFGGFQNGETLATSGVSGRPSITSNDTASSPAGTYTITLSPGSLAATNYTSTFFSGQLTAHKAPLQ